LVGSTTVVPSRNREKAIADIVRIAREQEVGTIVVGLPRNMDGSEGPRAELCRQFAQDLGQATGLEINKVLSGPHGGEDQIAARISYNEIDVLLFFRDPLTPTTREREEQNILRLCDVHNVPVATNIATAEVIILALERGDLDWRKLT